MVPSRVADAGTTSEGVRMPKLVAARIPPVLRTDVSEEELPLFDAVRGFTAAMGLLYHSPEMTAVFWPFAEYLKCAGRLPERQRELMILRTAWNCGVDWVWVVHEDIARQHGVRDDEIERVALGADAPG